MTHAAYVAIETDNDTYSLHYSDNGAYGTQLSELLVDHKQSLLDGSSRNLGSIELGPELQQLAENYRDHPTAELAASDTALEPEPTATGLPKAALGLPLDFADTELLYLVEADTPVRAYFPAWLNPAVIAPLRDRVSIEVYRQGAITPGEAETTSDPLRVIDTELLTDSAFLDDTIARRVLRDNHANIFALLGKAAYELQSTEVDLSNQAQILRTNSYDILVESLSDRDWLPRMGGIGVFIALGPDTRREVELEVAKRRFDLGTELAALRRPASDEERSLSTAELLIGLFQEYGDRLATFSPPPYGSLVEAFTQTPIDMSNADTVARRLHGTEPPAYDQE